MYGTGGACKRTPHYVLMHVPLILLFLVLPFAVFPRVPSLACAFVPLDLARCRANARCIFVCLFHHASFAYLRERQVQGSVLREVRERGQDQRLSGEQGVGGVSRGSPNGAPRERSRGERRAE